MKMVNNICIIDPVGGHGGMDYYDYGLAFGLGANEIEVHYQTCYKTNVRIFPNVTTYHTFKNLWSSNRFLKIIKYLTYHIVAFIKAKKLNSKLVHLHFFDFHLANFLILCIAKLFPFKTIVTVHDVDSFHKKSSLLIEKVSYKLIDGIILHNYSSLVALKEKNFLIPPFKIVPHGNYNPFVNMLPLPKLSNKLRLLFFGQIKEVKGLEILLSAISIVAKERPNVELTIAGRPWKNDKNKYIEHIKELNITKNIITHFRYIKDDEMETFFKNADVIVLPYKRIYQSGVLLLTMSYGRTAITSNLSAFEEIIRDGDNGFTFKSEDPKDLARCILDLNNDKIIKATTQAKNTITENYNWVKIGKNTKDFYNTICL